MENAVSLLVRTCRVYYRGPDRLDVTRMSAKAEGIAFAPSWGILRPALDARRDGRLDEAWPGYLADYMSEMRRSFREQRAAWDALLARETVTLVCYCVQADRCHRTLLAGILAKLGATYEGEIRDAAAEER